MRPFAATLSLLSPLLLSAQTASPGAGAGPLATYRNEALHLTYSYPSDFVDASPLVKPAFEASVGEDAAAASATQCVSLPFSRMAQGKGDVDLVLLVRQDGSCLKHKLDAKSVMDIARGEANGLAQAGGKPNFGKPVNYKVADRAASMLQGSFTLPTGQAMQAMVVCVLAQPDIACWQFLSSTTAGLGTLGSLPVSFDGSPATPLVPAGVLTSSK